MPYENEYNLTGQNPSLECCQCLEILTHIQKGLDPLIDKIWCLYVEGLQSYWPSNFKNDSTLAQLELGPSGSTRAGAGQQSFFETSNFDS